MEDAELLSLHLTDRTGTAFGAVVAKHVNLVYSSALRQTGGDHHRAQEVTQMVFIRLARKAASLIRHPALAAWLYRTTRLEAADLCRREARRRRHEGASASEPSAEPAGVSERDWRRLAPVIDDAIGRLGETDREAIVLRYFANQPFAEVGRRLSLSENAARMRVDRALDKLRQILASRGVTSTAAAIAAMLANEAIAVAPAGVSAAASAAAATAAVGGSLAAGAFLSMTANKIALGAFGVAVAASVGAVAVQQHTSRVISSQVASEESGSAGLSDVQHENRALRATLEDAQNLGSAVRAAIPLYVKTQALEKEVDRMKAQVALNRQRASQPISNAYDVSGLDVLPKATFQIRPVYPPSMRSQGQSGQATVDFVVDAQGNVRNATVVSSTGTEFEQAAIDAVSQWTFSPGQKGGSAVSTHMQVPIVFALNPDPGAGSSMTADAAESAPGGQATYYSGNVKFYVSTQPQGKQPAPASPSAWFPGPNG